jgi:hypothetical protein
VLISIGVRYVAAEREELSARLAFHVVFATAIFGVLVLKILVVRFFRGYLRIVPTLGFALFVLTILVYSVSAGFFFIHSASSGIAGPQAPNGGIIAREIEPDSASVAAGKVLYEKSCAYCHYADRADGKLGPGLKGLLKVETLPSSGRPATIENVMLQLKEPIGTMPAFTAFTEDELACLSAYLASI